MTAGAIRQSAIDIYPKASGATRNRQVITPTQAVINHCAELEMCPPIRVSGSSSTRRSRSPITCEWLDAFCAMPSRTSPRSRSSCSRRLPDLRGAAARMEGHRFHERTHPDHPDQEQEPAPAPHAAAAAGRAGEPAADAKPFGEPESTLRAAWDRTVERRRPAIARLTFHSCRHGFATKLLHDGIDVVTVAKLGGWDRRIRCWRPTPTRRIRS
jgi:hypothetical protein